MSAPNLKPIHTAVEIFYSKTTNNNLMVALEETITKIIIIHPLGIMDVQKKKVFLHLDENL